MRTKKTDATANINDVQDTDCHININKAADAIRTVYVYRKCVGVYAVLMRDERLVHHLHYFPGSGQFGST